jgi:hypothetical protein
MKRLLILISLIVAVQFSYSQCTALFSVEYGEGYEIIIHDSSSAVNDTIVKWNYSFGNGHIYSATQLTTVHKTYNYADTFQLCLTIETMDSCFDTYCETVIIEDTCNYFITILDRVNQSDFGMSNGSVLAETSGGSLPYTYNWSNGSTNPEITSLDTGYYCVTVTESSGCSYIECARVETEQPTTSELLIGSDTKIEVCFTGVHSYVSDLGFYLIPPYVTSQGVPTTENEIIELMPTLNNNGGLPDFDESILGCNNLTGYPCQSGDNFNQFCFTTDLQSGNSSYTPCVCDMETPLSGNYAATGSWSELYGLPLSIGGWGIIVADCYSGDVGAVYDVTITFQNQETYTYDTSGVFDIPDNLCDFYSALNVKFPTEQFNCDPTFQYQITNDSIVTLNIDPGIMSIDTLLSYSIDYGDGSDPDTSLTHIYTQGGSYQIQYSIESSFGCNNFETHYINLSLPCDSFAASIYGHDPLYTNSLDGSAECIAYSGIPPYSYIWNNGTTESTAELLDTGYYCVTAIDAAGCTVTACTQLSAVDTTYLMIGFTTNNTSYQNSSDGYVEVGVYNAEPPFEYLWDSGDTVSYLDNVPMGFYCVTITDQYGNSRNACTYIGTDDPDPIGIVDSTTIIEVCFSASHTFVSDLGFYIIAPGYGHEFGQPSGPGLYGTVELLPPVSNWSETTNLNSNVLGCSDGVNTNCNSGDDVEDFCFTTELPAQDPASTACVCDLSAPLTGEFASAGPWEKIFGFPIHLGGWSVQIYDCVGADVGALESVKLKFIEENQVTIYDSGNMYSAINDNSCNYTEASIFALPVLPFVMLYSDSLVNGNDYSNPVDTITVTYAGNCLINPYMNIDSAYIGDYLVESSDFVMVNWVIWQNGSPDTILLEYAYNEPGVNLTELLIVCNNGSKEINQNETAFYFSDYINVVQAQAKTDDFINQFEVYPNPARDKIYVKKTIENTGALEIKIYNPLGEVVKVGSLNSEITSIELDNFSSGLYLYEITESNRSVSRGKIIVKSVRL